MIRIRAATPDDAAQIAAIFAPFVAASAISFETEPPTTQQMRARITASKGFYPWLVATSEDEDAILGYAFATSFRDRPAYRYVVETAIYIAGDIKRKAVGRLLYEALVDTLRAQDFTQAISGISLPDDALISLHESLGFRRAGVYRAVGYKHGEWRDVGFWQLELTKADNPPSDPKPFSEVGLVRED